MVAMAATLFSSDSRMEAKGSTVSVDVAEGVLNSALSDQRKPRIHLGHCHHSMLVLFSFRSSCCAIFHLVLAIAVVTDVPVTAGDHNALSCIPSLTDWDVITISEFLAFSIIRS